MKSISFYITLGSFIAGVLLASFVPVPRAGVFIGLSACLFSAIIARLHRRRIPVLALSVCAGIGFFLGALRFDLSQSDEHPLDRYIGRRATIEGVICAEPDQKADGQRFCFQPEKGGDRIVVSGPKTPRYTYGDELVVTATLKLPENFETFEGGPEFDYVSYLAKDDIRYKMSFPKIQRTGNGRGNPIVAALISMKSAFMDRIRKYLPEPESSFVGGLILGEKGTLPEDVTEDFRRSGLTHILVLSGSNVTVVAESLLAVFSFLPRTMGRAAGGISVVLFALMTGASATTVRATIMALIHLFADGMGRPYDVVRALVVSACIMLLQNPCILAFDISFQLSFLATIAVIFVAPLVKERLSFIPERFGLRETLSMTIGTQIFTLPFILSKMGEISVIALIPNLLVLPAVPYAMLGGFAVGVAGFVSRFVAVPIAWVTDILLLSMLKVVEMFGALSFATIKAPVGAPLCVISYIGLVVVLICLRRRDSSRQTSS
ncbi:MAG TPA: ComEC/Rec2 family competence protein [Candidatus Paceibacterota bacterium]|nr:ComEC/Rec2 family competence protein [Candidatus Paceibacterota bacterium]